MSILQNVLFGYSEAIYTPSANFSADTTSIIESGSVDFTDTSTVPSGGDPITAWSWSFEGGTPSSATTQNVSGVTYYGTGSFDVSLKVTNSDGSSTELKSNYISVSPRPIIAPTASFTADQTNITASNAVQFTDTSTSGSATITNWNWVFEGGTPSTSTSQNPSITYNTSGSFDVTLSVTSSDGSDSVTELNYINVAPAPPTLESRAEFFYFSPSGSSYTDYSPNGNDGTAEITGSATISYGTGFQDNKPTWQFANPSPSNSQAKIRTGVIPGNLGTGKWSFVIHHKAVTTSNYQYLFDAYDGANDELSLYRNTSNNLYGEYGASAINGSTYIGTGVWRTIFYICDGTNVKIYIGGSQEASGTASAVDVNAEITIGQTRLFGTGYSMSARIGGMAFWNGYELTAADRTELLSKFSGF